MAIIQEQEQGQGQGHEPKFDKKVVVIGGGTGTFTLLRGLTELNTLDKISSIPGMWDNGGSTGRLRSELGILPIGDPKHCLIGSMDDDTQREWAIALSNDRFKDRTGPLQGHDFFNLQLDLLISAAGGTQEGIDAFRELYRIKPHVYPVTLKNIDLGAIIVGGPDLEGEEKLDERWKDPSIDLANNPVEDVYLSQKAKANTLAAQAIKEADKIIFPPGSFFGSILPHAQIDGIIEALHESKGEIIFVSNIMTERGQTDTRRKTSDYFGRFVREFNLRDRIDYLVVNQNGVGEEPLELYLEKGHQFPIEFDDEACLNAAPNVKVVSRSLAIYVNRLVRHDSRKLAETVLEPDKYLLEV